MTNRLRNQAMLPAAAALAAVLAIGGTAQGAADLYIKDTPADAGLEPNPDSGPMWVSQDIWVRTTPDPNYLPYPFPEASPPWTPALHENPEYRDPKYSVPNYVYVRVRNRGDAASTGTERLKVYWAKASTGLAWPAQWVDYLASNCGPTKLYGAEITKPRKNAAAATAAERTAYQQAIVAIGTSAAFTFFGGTHYWHKQEEVHKFGPSNRHGSPAFLPWHREFVNRYEVLLQEADPTVKLLYWDWTTDPENSGGVNLYPGFMGASGRGTGGVSIGLPFMPALAPPTVTRNLSVNTTPPPDADATLLGSGPYQNFAPDIEHVPNHNSAHPYIGGGGDMSSIPTAAQDPFFFLLHTNVDRLWAQWQRAPASLSRIDRNTAYDLDQSDANITTTMGPWDGTGTTIQPWTVAGGYIVSKAPTNASVVSPPIYDTAPLTIPVLQPGEAVVIQVPWYPPNPADFGCFGGDQGHFCLLARIETSISAPFGMTFTEGTDINTNVRNNNNIAWKNVTVVDNFPGAFRLTSILVRNLFRQRVATSLHFVNTEEIGGSFFDFGTLVVDLKPELFKRLNEAGVAGREIERLGGTTVRLRSPTALLQNVRLEPEEVFSIDVSFELNKDYRLPRGVRPKVDLIQIGAPDKPNAVVGGQRFELDFSKLVLIKSGADWRYLDDGSIPGRDWPSPDFDDSKWKLGRAALGFGNNPVTTIDGGPPGRRHTAAYFRHAFDLADPSFLRTVQMRLRRNDGAVVYLNGTEIYRVNLPEGAVAPKIPATRDVRGLERNVLFPVTVPLDRLHQGRNVVAVEVHLASPAAPDLSFDLELYANPAVASVPPDVAIAAPPAGALLQAGETIPVDVEALSAGGRVATVSLFADGKQVGTAEQAPYRFTWQGATLGSHRLRAVATNTERQQATAEATVTIVEKLPPVVRLTQPHDGAVFHPGDGIALFAQAADRGGKVDSVEFRLRDGDLFIAPDRVVGTVTDPPYTVVLSGLAPGHYALTAFARNDRGIMSQSVPIHFEVQH